jgi:SAM-dependent methyltransferase
MPDADPSGASYDAWADYYDLIDVDRARDVAFYRGLVDERTRSLIELGCGTGAVLIPMAQDLIRRHGYPAKGQIVGVDISEPMLRVARQRESRIDWIHGDIRHPPVQGQFDLVICCFNMLQALLTDEDFVQALGAVRSLLAPEGIFAFDIYQPNLSYIRTPVTNRLARSGADRTGRELEVREDSGYDEESRVLTVRWRLVECGQDAGPPIATMEQRLRQYFVADIERLLPPTALAVRQRYGEFDLSAFTSNSKKQIVICGRG